MDHSNKLMSTEQIAVGVIGTGGMGGMHAALAMSTADYLEVPYDPPAWSVDRRDFMQKLTKLTGSAAAAAAVVPVLAASKAKAAIVGTLAIKR